MIRCDVVTARSAAGVKNTMRPLESTLRRPATSWKVVSFRSRKVTSLREAGSIGSSNSTTTTLFVATSLPLGFT